MSKDGEPTLNSIKMMDDSVPPPPYPGPSPEPPNESEKNGTGEYNICIPVSL